MDQDILQEVRSCLDRLETLYPEVGGRVRLATGDYGTDWLAIAGHLSVTLNEPYWTREALAHHASEWRGFAIASDIGGIIVHEFGHILFRTAERLLGFDEANRLAMKYAGTDRWDGGIEVTRAASVYGQENVSECLAESFSAFHYGRAEAGVFSGQALTRAQAFWSDLLARMRRAMQAGPEPPCQADRQSSLAVLG